MAMPAIILALDRRRGWRNSFTWEDSVREGGTMRYLLVALIVVSIGIMGGCAGMTETQQRTVTGGAGGAAGGAIIGAIAGNAGLGAAIGGAAGLAGGYLYGRHEDSKQAAYQQGLADGSRQSQPTSGSR
jgi:osmotically inducible lipoprotein OsmB